MAETPERLPPAAHAAAVRAPTGAEGDAPLLPRASATWASSTGSARRCPTRRSPPTSSSASPARPRPTSQHTLDVVRAGAVRRRVHLPVLQAARAPRPRPWTTRCPRRSCRSATSGWSRSSRRSPGRRTRQLVGPHGRGAGRRGRGPQGRGHRPDVRPGPRQPAGALHAPATDAPSRGPATSSTVEITYAAPHHLVSDAPVLSVRRRHADTGTAPTSPSPAVLLGLPVVGPPDASAR